MDFELKISGCFDCNLKAVKICDKTGVYSIANPGGYGGGVNPTPGNFNALTVSVLMPGATVETVITTILPTDLLNENGLCYTLSDTDLGTASRPDGDWQFTVNATGTWLQPEVLPVSGTIYQVTVFVLTAQELWIDGIFVQDFTNMVVTDIVANINANGGLPFTAQQTGQYSFILLAKAGQGAGLDAKSINWITTKAIGGTVQWDTAFSEWIPEQTVDLDVDAFSEDYNTCLVECCVDKLYIKTTGAISGCGCSKSELLAKAEEASMYLEATKNAASCGNTDAANTNLATLQSICNDNGCGCK